MNYLINALLAAALFVGFQIAQADVQINEDGTCHVPQDDNNGGVEIKTVCDRSLISQKPDGTASGYARIDSVEWSKHILVEPLADGENFRTDNYNGDGGVPCNMNTENGTTYTTLNWTANIQLTRNLPWKHKVQVTMNCYGGQAN